MSLPAEGWHHYLSELPPRGVLLEWGRFTTGWEWRVIAHHRAHFIQPLSPEHLYWRWTGIGKEEFACQTKVAVAPGVRWNSMEWISQM